MAVSVQESDVHAGLREGGRLRNVIVVSRDKDDGPEFLAYLQPSWIKDNFAALHTWRARSERTYRDLDRLLSLIRDDFGFRGPITIYLQGDPALRRKQGVHVGDMGQA